MKKTIVIAFLALLTTGVKATAQTFEVPAGYTLKTSEDYGKYEQDVIKAVDWLQKTPWTEQEDKRKTVNKFLMDWINGSDKVTLTITKPLIDITENNGQLLMTYMGQYSKYILQQKENPDKKLADVNAIKAVIEKYKSEPSHVKNSNMENLIKTEKDGNLESWIDSVLHKS